MQDVPAQGDPRERPAIGRRLACGWFGLCLALSLAVSAPALRGDFVFDDRTAVLQVAAGHELDDIPDILRFWEPRETRYRPLRYASLVLDWHLGGGSPLPFHLTNVLLHAACGWSLGLLLLRLGAGRGVALVAVLLFLLHPLQSAAVAYISGRKDLLCAFWYLAALHAHLGAGRAAGRASRLLLVAAFGVCALLAWLAKEMALTLPAAAWLVDRLDPAQPVSARGELRTWLAALRRRRLLYGGILLAGLAALVRSTVLRPGAGSLPFLGGGLPERLPLALQTLAWQVRKALWPWPQAADLRGLFPARRLPDGEALPATWGEIWNGGGLAVTAAGLLLLATLILVVVRASGRRRPAAAAGLFFFLVALLPVLNLARLTEPAAEHYLYLPLAGLATLLAALLAPREFPGPRPLRPHAIGVALLLLGLGTAATLRSAVWRGPEPLWRSVLAVNRTGARAHTNLALARLAAGDTAAAERLLRRAVRIEPGEPRAAANLMSLLRADDPAAAARLGEAALHLSPRNRLLLSLQGSLLLQLGDAEGARTLLERVASLPGGGDPPAPGWTRDRGVALLMTGDLQGAVTVLEEAAAADPEDASLWTNLGVALLQLERPQEAERALRRAAALPGASGMAHRNLAVLLLRRGEAEEAARELDRASAAGDAVPPDLAAAVAESLRAVTPPR